MADIFRAVGGIFDGVNQAVCSVFHLVGAFGRLNSAFLNGVIQAAKDCCFAVSMIGTSLWAALLEILCYIADFFLEVFQVFYGCVKVISKLGLLIYMLCGACIQILSIAIQWLMKFLTAMSRQCYQGLCCFGLLFKDAWQEFKLAFFDATAATAETARSVGNQTLTASQKAAESAISYLQIIGDSVTDQFLEIFGVISHFVNSYFHSLTTCVTDAWSGFTTNLQHFGKSLTLPGNLISQDLKASIQDYFPNIELTFNDLLVILLIPSGTIFIVRFMLNYLNQKGMTFPLIERPQPGRIRPRFRPQYFVESSDEDLTEDYGNESDDADEVLDEVGDEDETGYSDQDAIAVFAAGEVDHEYEESEDFSFEGDEGDAFDEDSEVEEFEVATDTDESEEEEDVQIKVELPTMGGYNLRERTTSEDPVFRQKLSPEELEKILENERDRRICVVCTDQPKTVVVLPCKHMCLCVDCAHEIVRQRPARRVCPLCRSRFNTVMHIYA